MLFGTTGAGKSTLIQYLYGAKMAQFQGGHIEAKHPFPIELCDFKSSAAMTSCTRYINAIEITIDKQNNEKQNITLVDTPGFGDTQSVEVDISNTIGIVRSAIKAEKIYPVILFSQKNQGAKSEYMKKQIEFYLTLFKNIKETK